MIQEVPLLFLVGMDTSIIKVFYQLRSSFYRQKLQPYHLYNFRDIQRNSKLSQDDEFKAWMLAADEKRESFDYSVFLRDFLERKNTFSESEKL